MTPGASQLSSRTLLTASRNFPASSRLNSPHGGSECTTLGTPVSIGPMLASNHPRQNGHCTRPVVLITAQIPLAPRALGGSRRNRFLHRLLLRASTHRFASSSVPNCASCTSPDGSVRSACHFLCSQHTLPASVSGAPQRART